MPVFIQRIGRRSAMDALSRMFFQPKGGMYRDFHALKAYFEPTDLALYRRLLPEPLDMPDLPVVMVFVADYIKVVSWMMPTYREAAVSLRSSYSGEVGWYILTMP